MSDFFITIAPVYETAPATQRTAAREMRLSFKTGQDVGNGRRPSNYNNAHHAASAVPARPGSPAGGGLGWP